MADSFTMFEKFGDVCAKLEEPDRKELMYAICMYGMYGEEVELPYLLSAVFESLKEDIDNSKEMRKRGCKGGRPRRSDEEKPQVAEVSENRKPEVSDCGNQEREQVSETEKPVVSEKPAKTETQTKPIQTKPVQTKPTHRESARTAKRFVPPARDEAVAFGGEIGLPESEVDRFLDHFAANGWKVSGRAPMRDWRAAMRNWKRNVPDFPHPGRDGPGPAPRPENDVPTDDEIAAARAEVERLEAACGA